MLKASKGSSHNTARTLDSSVFNMCVCVYTHMYTCLAYNATCICLQYTENNRVSTVVRNILGMYQIGKNRGLSLFISYNSVQLHFLNKHLVLSFLKAQILKLKGVLRDYLVCPETVLHTPKVTE